MNANTRSNHASRVAAPVASPVASPVVKPTLLIVGAQKGGVGKTTVARLLMHWLDENRRTHVAFDTEAPLGSLIRFHDDKTELVDIAEVPAQMRIFDTVANDRSGSTFVVDLRAGQLYAVLDLLTDLRILRDAKDGAFDVVFLHIIGGSIESIREVGGTLDRFSGAKHIIVTNPGNGADLADWEASEVRANIERDGGVEINIPALNKQTYLEIERAGTTFSQFVNNKGKNGADASYSYVLRGYARNWLFKAMTEIDRINL
jgi:CobQ/CobB/MinD/ParA family nucleotide binding protein